MTVTGDALTEEDSSGLHDNHRPKSKRRGSRDDRDPRNCTLRESSPGLQNGRDFNGESTHLYWQRDICYDAPA